MIWIKHSQTATLTLVWSTSKKKQREIEKFENNKLLEFKDTNRFFKDGTHAKLWLVKWMFWPWKVTSRTTKVRPVNSASCTTHVRQAHLVTPQRFDKVGKFVASQSLTSQGCRTTKVWKANMVAPSMRDKFVNIVAPIRSDNFNVHRTCRTSDKLQFTM